MTLWQQERKEDSRAKQIFHFATTEIHVNLRLCAWEETKDKHFTTISNEVQIHRNVSKYERREREGKTEPHLSDTFYANSHRLECVGRLFGRMNGMKWKTKKELMKQMFEVNQHQENYNGITIIT